MSQPSAAPRVHILGVTPQAMLGDGSVLLVRAATTTTDERLLGTRAILLIRPGVEEKELRQIATAALDEVDHDASASAVETARRALTRVQERLGLGVRAGMIGIAHGTVWSARLGEIGIAAKLNQDEKQAIVRLPDDAPNAKKSAVARQGVNSVQIPLAVGDKVALADTVAEAKKLLRASKDEEEAGANPVEFDQPALLLALVLPHVELRGARAPDRDTLLSLPVDPVAAAAALARARWEEGNDERAKRITASTPPKPQGDPDRPARGTTPYVPIDTAARAVFERRHAVARGDAPVRGGTTAPPTRDERLEEATRASREAARAEAKARAQRERSAIPTVERSWVERAAASPSPAQRLVARAIAALERRYPWLAPAPREATLKAQTARPAPTATELARRGRQRAARAGLAAILVAAIGGGAALYISGVNPELDAAARGRIAMERATQEIDEALNPETQLLENDPARVKELLLDASAQLVIAEAGGVDVIKIANQRARAEATLNALFLVTTTSPVDLFDFAKGGATINITSIVRGPDGLPYVLDDNTGAVYRVNPTDGRAKMIYQPGFDLYGARTGKPLIIAAAGPDVLIFDASANLWRWRPANKEGQGTLVKLRVRDAETWGADIRTITGFAADSGTGLYRLYVVDPSAKQILRYQPAPDGTGYPAAPTGFFVTVMNLSNVDDMAIDGYLYLAQDGVITRYVAGTIDDWTPEEIGDSLVRPTPRITLLASVGDPQTGVLYAWDAAAHRVIAYSKGAGGMMLGQYILTDGAGPVDNIIGGYVVPATDGGTPTFIWAEATRIRSAVLGAKINPTPGASPSPTATPKPIIEVP
jgi:hypothetical protein